MGDHSATRKDYTREEQIRDLKYGNNFLVRFFCVICLPKPCGRHREPFDQVSKFGRERIVAYRDCGFFFREIGRDGRNQATVMRICHRCTQEETTGRRGP
ncbi:hypothetical protein TNCV_1617081 [Trichonephila clavipes]|nr:hypothetical protein TNCV_1617081 [Trichonephila clavipes]